MNKNFKSINKALLPLCIGLLTVNANAATDNLTTVDTISGYKYIDISKTDANRVYCESGEITEIVYSEEKELTIQKMGQNAIVKLTPINEMQGEEVKSTTINDFTRETYITCNGNMYSLVLVPKDMQAQTIILRTPKGEDIAKKQNKGVVIVNEYQSTLTDLIKRAYKESPMDEFTIEYPNKITQEFKELVMLEYKRYIGDVYNIQEFIVKANNEDISIDEKLFIPFLNNPIAVALESFKVKAKTSTRLFVISNSLPDSITTEEQKNILDDFLSEKKKVQLSEDELDEIKHKKIKEAEIKKYQEKKEGVANVK